MSNLEQIVNEIADALYRGAFLKSEKEKVERVVLSESSNISKANEICEQLGIQKRGNRQSIYSVLNKYF